MKRILATMICICVLLSITVFAIDTNTPVAVSNPAPDEFIASMDNFFDNSFRQNNNYRIYGRDGELITGEFYQMFIDEYMDGDYQTIYNYFCTQVSHTARNVTNITHLRDGSYTYEDTEYIETTVFPNESNVFMGIFCMFEFYKYFEYNAAVDSIINDDCDFDFATAGPDYWEEVISERCNGSSRVINSGQAVRFTGNFYAITGGEALYTTELHYSYSVSDTVTA